MLLGTLLRLSVLGALMVRNVPGLALCVALLTQRFHPGSVYWAYRCQTTIWPENCSLTPL